MEQFCKKTKREYGKYRYCKLTYRCKSLFEVPVYRYENAARPKLRSRAERPPPPAFSSRPSAAGLPRPAASKPRPARPPPGGTPPPGRPAAPGVWHALGIRAHRESLAAPSVCQSGTYVLATTVYYTLLKIFKGSLTLTRKMFRL